MNIKVLDSKEAWF
jgi:hypothetical protein